MERDARETLRTFTGARADARKMRNKPSKSRDMPPRHRHA